MDNGYFINYQLFIINYQLSIINHQLYNKENIDYASLERVSGAT